MGSTSAPLIIWKLNRTLNQQDLSFQIRFLTHNPSKFHYNRLQCVVKIGLKLKIDLGARLYKIFLTFKCLGYILRTIDPGKSIFLSISDKKTLEKRRSSNHHKSVTTLYSIYTVIWIYFLVIIPFGIWLLKFLELFPFFSIKFSRVFKIIPWIISWIARSSARTK